MVLLESRRRAAAIKHDDGGGLLKTGRKRLQGEPTCFTVTNRFQWKVIGSQDGQFRKWERMMRIFEDTL
ncbi:hypothetical protein HUJ05_000582 [Dendroctonus ponderosae]|nr:hypothetical protein HUJ05_000582 [Dendroctonus ponderosae]